MSGECDKCCEHCLDCKCPIICERKWVSREEAEKMFPSYGKEVYLNIPIVCKSCAKEPIDCECVHG